MKTLIVVGGILIVGVSTWISSSLKPEVLAGDTEVAAPDARSTDVSELERKIDELKSQLEEQLRENERLAAANAALEEDVSELQESLAQKKQGTPVPTALPVPVYFPEDRRLLGNASLYFQSSTNAAGKHVWSPVVFLPPGSRYAFTRVVTNVVERTVERTSPPAAPGTSYNISQAYYVPSHSYWPLVAVPAQGQTPSVRSPSLPQQQRLPRVGSSRGFPPPLPRAGGADIRWHPPGSISVP